MVERGRPRTGILVTGTVFLLIGCLAVLADLTTLDASWILPIVLMTAGLLALILIVARIRAATDPTGPDPTGVDPQ